MRTPNHALPPVVLHTLKLFLQPSIHIRLIRTIEVQVQHRITPPKYGSSSVLDSECIALYGIYHPSHVCILNCHSTYNTLCHLIGHSLTFALSMHTVNATCSVSFATAPYAIKCTTLLQSEYQSFELSIQPDLCLPLPQSASPEFSH